MTPINDWEKFLEIPITESTLEYIEECIDSRLDRLTGSETEKYLKYYQTKECAYYNKKPLEFTEQTKYNDNESYLLTQTKVVNNKMRLSEIDIENILSYIMDPVLKEKAEVALNNEFTRNQIGYVDLENDKRLICAALSESSAHNLLGSEGDRRASRLAFQLKYENYCINHHKTCEELDEFDYENIEEERYRDINYEFF